MIEKPSYLQKTKKRGERRFQKKLAKKKARSLIAKWYNHITNSDELNNIISDKNIGITANTPKRYSDSNPRKYGEKTLQEIKDQYNIKGQLEELEGELDDE